MIKYLLARYFLFRYHFPLGNTHVIIYYPLRIINSCPSAAKYSITRELHFVSFLNQNREQQVTKSVDLRDNSPWVSFRNQLPLVNNIIICQGDWETCKVLFVGHGNKKQPNTLSHMSIAHFKSLVENKTKHKHMWKNIQSWKQKKKSLANVRVGKYLDNELLKAPLKDNKFQC